MESATVLRSFNGALQSITSAKASGNKPALASGWSASSKVYSPFQVPVECQRLICLSPYQKGSLLSRVKASGSTSTLISNANASDSTPQGLLQKKDVQKSTFPNGFETLLRDVCDETDVAELKLKVGNFEMHLKRDIGTSKASPPIVPAAYPAAAPPAPTASPAPSKPKVEAGPPQQAVTQKSTKTTTIPFANVISAKASKLAALEASGLNTYVLISSPTVGLFRSGRTLKGKKQPPSCKEGDMIKEGQVIGFVDQFGSELPVRSDASGEVLKVLFKDGEAVGYGDPLVAVLPSFHGIK